MEKIIDSDTGQQKLEMDDNSLKHLRETRKWSMFLSVAGFVFLGIMLIAFIAMIGRDSAFGAVGPQGATFLPLLILIAIYFFPIYFLYQFSSYSKRAMEGSDSSMLATAFRFLKMHYKYMGIMFIVIFSIYLVVILIAVSTGGFGNLFN